MNKKTLLIIKPDAIKNKFVGKIIEILEKNDLNINQINIIKFNKDTATTFYQEHKNKSFFDELISFITSNNIITIILKGDNIITKVRELIGDTNYKKSKKGTIRNLFAKGLTENAVHASDSDNSFQREYKIIQNVINNMKYE